MVEPLGQVVDERELLRWSWVEIDKSAIRYNVRQARNLIGPAKKLMAVVKADAYGHGAVEVSRVALAAGADELGVATVQEALGLRESGISAPILVLSEPPISTVGLLAQNDITPSVYTAQFAIAYGDAADAIGKVGPYHMAVNTGMNRIGVLDENVVMFLRDMDFHRGLKLEGVFTHYATADTPDRWDYKVQFDRFNDAICAIRDAGFDPGIVHAANSAATIRYPSSHFDMVRFGISLYGLHSSPVTRDYCDLKPAMSVHAKITDVRTPRVGEGVSYGLRYRCLGDRQIATIPIGYADGMSRVLSGCVDVLVDGMRCPQVGTICMDQMMIEITPSQAFGRKAPVVDIGDEVVIVGRQGDEEITLDELADKAGTITHEVAIGFGQRMQRFYV